MLKILNCTKRNFEELIKNNRVICFGSGKGLSDVLKQYPFIIKKIDCIVDTYKSGGSYEFSGYKIPIVSIEVIKNISKGTVFVISTLLYASEIIEKLDLIPEFNGVSTYVPAIFGNDKIDSINIKKKKERIPRKIHYFWVGGAELPMRFKQNIETWKQMCPDYELVRWDESNYDISKCKYMKEAYDKKKWGFVSDYARLDIINMYGGIYLDTDVEILKPLDDFLGYDLFCGFESDEYVNLGLGFGGTADNSILNDMLREYEQMTFVKEDGSLNLVPCPIIQTSILKTYGLKCDGSYQKFENTIVVPREFFSPYNSIGLGQITENTVSIHQYAATWFDDVMLENKRKLSDNIRYLLIRLQQ